MSWSCNNYNLLTGWNTKPEVLKYGPILRGPCVKNEDLVFHGTARAIRLINSLFNGENESTPKIHREFSDNFPKKLFFMKLVQNHFPRVFCSYSNFPKIVRKLTEDFPKNNRSRVSSKVFSRVLQLSEVFREFWDNFGQRAFSVLFSSWIHQAGWRYPARWSANQIARKQSRMSSH